jgi:hypothetical protein
MGLKHYKKGYKILICIILLWLAIASMVFAFRHPWMTDTQRILNIHNIILLKNVQQTK